MCISENNVAGKATNSFCYEFKDWRKVALISKQRKDVSYTLMVLFSNIELIYILAH